MSDQIVNITVVKTVRSIVVNVAEVRGPRGATGEAGYTPEKGVDYFDGATGPAGHTPVKGVDYFDGDTGPAGHTPVKGIDYFDGATGPAGHTPVKGVDYFDGAQGAQGPTGPAGNLSENDGLELVATLSADGKYSGIVEGGTAGTAISFGQLCYLRASDTKWMLADANLPSGYDKKLGICVISAISGGTTKMLVFGKIRADSLFPSLTAGAPVYMSETAGGIVVAQPVTTDAAIRIIGFANNVQELFFNPSPDYITHI